MQLSKKYIIYFVLALICWHSCVVEPKDTSSLSADVAKQSKMKDDTSRVLFLDKMFADYLVTDHEQAHAFALQGMKLSKKLGYLEGQARFLYDLGYLHYVEGRYKKALDYWLRSLSIRERMGKKKPMAKSLNSVGSVFFALQNYNKAREYFKRSIDICSGIEDYSDLQAALSNLGAIEIGLENYNKALFYYKKVIDLGRELQISDNTDVLYMQNVAFIYRKQGKFKQAIDILKQAIQLCEKYNVQTYLANINLSFGNIYFTEHNYIKALEYYNKAKDVALEKNVMDDYSNACYNLSQVYNELGQYQDAYKYLELYKDISDSLLNEKSNKQIAEMETKYQTVQKEKKISIQHANLERQMGELKRQRIIIVAFVGGLLMLGFITFLLIRQNRIRKKANREISRANEIIVQKNLDITDSIKYASRIQHAILPPDPYWLSFMPDSFVLFKPKDIVSGDFYWMDYSEGKVLFAAVDCTGHGVPGAFMSIIGFNGLNKAVKEHGTKKPGEILKHLNESVRDSVGRYESNVRDGMDIALCSVDFKKHKLEFAGAVNPVYITTEHGDLWPKEMHLMQKDHQTLIEIKGNKCFIGDELKAPFTNHEYQLNTGDVLYLFSDGYADQFGGPKGKKYKYTRFREFILSICQLPLEQQRELLNSEIENWKGDLSQLDDILVIGTRI